MKKLEKKIYESRYCNEYGKIGPELDKLIEQQNLGTLDKTKVNLVKLKEDIVTLIAMTITGSKSGTDILSEMFSVEK